MEQNKCTCPNCGAAATNDFNCEYCGSMLLRFNKIGVDAKNTEYNKKENLLPELEKSIQYQSKLLKDYPDENISTVLFQEKITNFVKYNRDFSKPIERELITAQFINSRIIDPNANAGSITFQLNFYPSSKELIQFQKLNISKLFKAKKDSNLFSYLIEFGEDIESASRVSSQIMRELYGEKYFYHTGKIITKKASSFGIFQIKMQGNTTGIILLFLGSMGLVFLITLLIMYLSL